MNETKKNNKIELTKKGKIIVGAVILVIVAIVILIIVTVKKNSKNLTLLIDSNVEKSQLSSMTYSPGNSTELNVKTNGTVNLLYTFSDEMNHKVKWVVSNEEIAKVKNNDLIGLKAGTVTVYAISDANKKIKSNSITITFE